MALWNFNNSKMNLLLLVMIDLGGDRNQWVKRIKRPILDVEDVVKTHTTYVRKFVLLVDLVNPVK